MRDITNESRYNAMLDQITEWVRANQPAPLPRKWSREWFALAWMRWKVGHSFRDCWISA